MELGCLVDGHAATEQHRPLDRVTPERPGLPTGRNQLLHRRGLFWAIGIDQLLVLLLPLQQGHADRHHEPRYQSRESQGDHRFEVAIPPDPQDGRDQVARPDDGTHPGRGLAAGLSHCRDEGQHGHRHPGRDDVPGGDQGQHQDQENQQADDQGSLDRDLPRGEVGGDRHEEGDHARGDHLLGIAPEQEA